MSSRASSSTTGVGKTSITDRLVDHHTEFDPSFISTIGVDFRVRTFHVNGKVIKLQIWDTSGQERFRSITSSYYRGANGIIMAYDLTDPRSLRDIESLWLKEVDKYASPEASLLMVGNKRDLESSFGSRVDSTREMAKDFMRYCPPGRIICNVETSAKTGWGVEDAFLCLVEGMLNKACDKVRNPTRGGT